MYERRTGVSNCAASSLGPACPGQRMFRADGAGGLRHARSACDCTVDTRSGHATGHGRIDTELGLRNSFNPNIGQG
ncbi:MAG TPA: hypothetical protein VFO07_10540 [Roseiflexaceae bacterium]|nr:hypothetical protein [Roseiflexaceae bacterium]